MTGPDLVTSLVAGGLAPGARVLDLGCGTGRFARVLARAGFRVVGVDEDVDAVETAGTWGDVGGDVGADVRDDDDVGVERVDTRGDERAAGERSPAYLAARAADLPFADASFEAVVCLDVFHWSADEAAFCAAWDQAWRVLRPGGVLLARSLVRDARAEAADDRMPGVAARGGARGWAYVPPRPFLDTVLARRGAVWLWPPRAHPEAAPREASGVWPCLFAARRPV